MAELTKGTKEKYQKLKKLIIHHQCLYHEKDTPEISDEAYDSLLRELNNLESKFPSLKSKNTPSEKVGGQSLGSFKKIKHKIRQWSYDNVFSFDIYFRILKNLYYRFRRTRS